MNTIVKETAYILPENVITNESLVATYRDDYEKVRSEKLNGDTIFRVCGIKERRYVSENTRLRDLGKDVIIKLLKNANLKLTDIDCIILTTLSPETYTPSNASLVLKELVDFYNIDNFHITTFDINAACTAPLFAIELADNYIRLGKKKRIIICSVEIVSRMLNQWDYHTGILFGDGAGAILLESSITDKGIVYTECNSVSDNVNDINYLSSLSTQFDKRLKLKGSRVYKNGVTITTDAIIKYFKENNITIDMFDYFIFHQANDRMLVEIEETLKIPSEKMLKNIEKVGNTAGASIPICLAQFNENNTFKKGNRILMCGFGAGYTYGIVDFYY